MSSLTRILRGVTALLCLIAGALALAQETCPAKPFA